ncbi:MAG TPA: PAS domain-containing protein [Stellaceae bacterium]|nr:PAS domain-containing protein [Stellaceae bacterium]
MAVGGAGCAQRFRALIRDELLRLVFDHWASARGERLMPSWCDIDPAKMKPALPLVWAWRLDETGEFVGRLAGERVIGTLGINLHGKRPRELFPEEVARVAEARYRRVLGEPALCHMRGAIFVFDEREGQGERIMMPLGPEPGSGGGIIGATVYEHPRLWRGIVGRTPYDTATFIPLKEES